ncbi:MAG: hypothetical protein PHW10_00505 [Candidatus Peribacteraceae bacterium]|nr:hypothetical protein [Candidatus Peribacteraceae bacterium]
MALHPEGYECRVQADPVRISRETGMTVLPLRMMENDDWIVSVPRIEAIQCNAAERLRPYLSPKMTGEYRVQGDPVTISQSTGLTLQMKGARENDDRVVSVSPLDRERRDVEGLLQQFLAARGDGELRQHPDVRKQAA